MSVVVECPEAEDISMQVATNRGWMDVIDWADDLDNETYPALLGFVDHGECYDIPALIADVDSAIANDRPDDGSVLKTLRGFRSFLKKHEGESGVIISDGFEPGDGDGDDDVDAPDESRHNN